MAAAVQSGCAGRVEEAVSYDIYRVPPANFKSLTFLGVAKPKDVKPDFGPQFVDWLPFVDASWNDFLKAGLRSAGMN